MKKTIIRSFSALLLSLVIFASGCGISGQDPAGSSGMVFKDGLAQSIFKVTYLDDENYTNEGSDILRFCVYVETDHDTDNDGMADLVKALVQVPRAAAEGKYKAATIYDPTPYNAGDCDFLFPESYEGFDEKIPFDYQLLYKDCEKRTPVSSETTLEAAKKADPNDWNYTIPMTVVSAYTDALGYDYFLMRGFAVVVACGIGTYGSEGFELCGMDLERDSHKCVVEWLAGNRKAYTDKTQNIEIAADWSNGNVAMTGCSYGGTLPFEVAVTGVEGLKTIIPAAGIASWYDYTNSQGAPTRFDTNYTDTLSASNGAGAFTDEEWTKSKPGYGSFLWQVHSDEEKTNGDYADIWAIKDYTRDCENINCSALVVQGINDYNVTSHQADLMMCAFASAGKPAKLVLHQEEHIEMEGRMVNGEVWEELLNRWLSHYLYGVDNGAENMAAVTVQSNVDGSWKTYDSWRDFSYQEYPAVNSEYGDTFTVSSGTIAETATEFFNEDAEKPDQVTSEQIYYLSLDGEQSAEYTLDIPENTTIYGVPEIHVKLSTEDVQKDGLMITAVLVDTIDETTEFPAYVSTPELEGGIPSEMSGETYYLDSKGGQPQTILRPVQMLTKAKNISYGWTDLQNPGCGFESSNYVYQEGELTPGEFYDYTFYMLPTVYTVAPGHQVKLVLTTWDPFRAFLDEDYNLDPQREAKYSFFTYGFTVDNSSVKAMIPVK